jgi:hypothetical protein
MADGEHAPVERMQAAVLDPMADRAAPEPEDAELGASDHAVLTPGQRRDQEIRAGRHFGIYHRPKCPRVVHAFRLTRRR